jgi:hypothetical protein
MQNQTKLSVPPPMADGYRDPAAGRRLYHWGSLRCGTIQPTDVDCFIGFVEFRRKLAIFFELKDIKGTHNWGQDRAYKVVCDAASRGGVGCVHTYYIFARHDVPKGVDVDDVGSILVGEYYHNGKTITPESPITIKAFIDNLLIKYDLYDEIYSK